MIRTELLKRNLEPRMEEIAPGRGARMWDTDDPPELAADLCLLLASGKADELSGCYFRAGARVQDDVESLLAHAAEIEERDLYKMRVARL